MKSIVLIDGEHYPPVNARAIKQLQVEGESPVLGLLIGGGEKMGQAPPEFGIPVENAVEDPEGALAAAIDRTGAGLVIDVSDDPVLGYVERCRMASVALWKGAAYKGADFQFTPPARPNRATVPSLAVIGTGKRTGKTSVSGTLARIMREEKLDPVVVAMGRGGPPQPETLSPEADLSPAALMELVREGRHAASDYIEDALTSGVPTVGAWRAGGGLAGATAFGNYADALAAARSLEPGMLILEGSGAAIPPAKWDAGILVVDARIDPAHLCGYFGLYRLLLADLVVLTMCERTVDGGHISTVEGCIQSCTLSQPTVVRTVFRPYPLGDVSGKKVWFATTASRSVTEVLSQHLHEHFNAEVVGVSHSLADRRALLEDLENTGDAEVLLVELKAAAVDVVTKHGFEAGMEVIYLDNRPEPEDISSDALRASFLEVAKLARRRFEKEGSAQGPKDPNNPISNGDTDLG